MPERPVLTPEEAAEYLGLFRRKDHKPNVKRLYQLPIPRVALSSRTFVFKREDLDRYIERKRFAA